jgi:hypothetical protein
MKSRLTRKEVNALYEAKRTVAMLRDQIETDDNARKIVVAARETVARLSAKRDNRIWL